MWLVDFFIHFLMHLFFFINVCLPTACLTRRETVCSGDQLRALHSHCSYSLEKKDTARLFSNSDSKCQLPNTECKLLLKVILLSSLCFSHTECNWLATFICTSDINIFFPLVLKVINWETNNTAVNTWFILTDWEHFMAALRGHEQTLMLLSGGSVILSLEK